MDYSKFEIEDFAADDYFIRWVMDADPEAARFWEAYKINNPVAAHKIDQARILLLNLRRAEQTLHRPAQVEKLWQQIEAVVSDISAFENPPKRQFTFLKIAASVSVLMLVAILYFSDHFFSYGPSQGIATTVDDGEFIEEVNTTGSVIRMHLSDGSLVSLEDNSRLRYRKDHTGLPYRQVYLSGEAFFDIAKNPKQPFIVYANEVVTKVLGTSFRVKAYDGDNDILVSVKEGKVSVYSALRKKKVADPIESEVNGVVLTPNQQVVYARKDNSFVKTLIDAPEVVNDAVQRAFVFKNASVKQVFGVLEKAYGVEIIFNEEVMQHCYLTVPLGDEPLFEKLKIICRTIGATYELIDTKVVVSSRGCSELVESEAPGDKTAP